MNAHANLIMDFGFHRGEDSDYYLKRGFQVVGIEANPELCDLARDRFADPIRSGALRIVNKALARKPGKITFYRNANSVWGTVDPLWAERNARMGAPSEEITVEATTMKALLAEFGVPEYAKIDIEGMDMAALEGLAEARERPTYVSIESEKDSFKALRHEFDVLQSLGYDRFKIVPQSKVPHQRCGAVPGHAFPEGSSGQFGEGAPGRWLTTSEAIEAYKAIFVRYAIVGDDPIFPRLVRSLAWRLGMRPDWYDTHAKLAGA